MLTPNEQAMRARCDAATKGPWANDDPSWMALNDITVWAPGGQESICNMGGSFAACDNKTEAQQNFDNGAFVAHARQDLPACLDTIEKLRAELAEARETVTNLLRYDWSGAESRVGLIAMGAYNGKNESANIEFARTAKIEAAQDAARAFLAKIKERNDGNK